MALNKLVTDLIDKEYDDNEQETSETKSEEFALKMNVLASASRPKAKARPRRRTPACSSTRTVPIGERFRTDIQPGTYSNIVYPVSKRLNTLHRHGQSPREEDGALEVWRIEDYLRRKSQLQGGGDNKKRFFNIVLTLVRTRKSLSPSSSRSFRPQSHWSDTPRHC